MEIFGVSHPVPKQFAKRIYNENKTVFVGKKYLSKASGKKFVIYESRGAGAYTGWADIEFIEKMDFKEIIKEYKDDLFITPEEFKEYVGRSSLFTVIKFKNFEKFKKTVVPKRFVSIAGKYIYKKEYDFILANKS